MASVFWFYVFSSKQKRFLEYKHIINQGRKGCEKAGGKPFGGIVTKNSQQQEEEREGKGSKTIMARELAHPALYTHPLLFKQSISRFV